MFKTNLLKSDNLNQNQYLPLGCSTAPEVARVLSSFSRLLQTSLAMGKTPFRVTFRSWFIPDSRAGRSTLAASATHLLRKKKEGESPSDSRAV